MNPWKVTIVSLIAATVMALILLAAFPSFAHQAPSGMVYNAWCCNGTNHTGDCQPIPSASVKAVPGGWQVTLRPGDHHMVTVPHQWVMEYDQTRESTDGQFHACLYPDENTLRCLYVPPMGM